MATSELGPLGSQYSTREGHDCCRDDTLAAVVKTDTDNRSRSVKLLPALVSVFAQLRPYHTHTKSAGNMTELGCIHEPLVLGGPNPSKVALT